jgi:HK97 family phage major capsid protein
MPAMTADQFKTHMKDVMLPLLQEVAPAMITEAVQASIETSLKPLREKQEQIGSVQDLIEKWRGAPAPIDVPVPDLGKGLALGQVLRAHAAAKRAGTGEAGAIDWAKKNAHPNVARWMEETATKALSSSDGTSGGFLVPVQVSQDIIEFLRPASVMRRMNPMTVQMPTGTMRIPKITQGSAATYIGENQNIAVTQPQFGQIVLSWKKLAAIVPISNDLVRYSSPSADAIVRDDLVRAMAQAENLAFLRGDGTAFSPKGLRFWINSANVLISAGTTLANMVTDIGAMILALLNNNIPMTRPAWLMSPRTWNSLNLVQTTTGAFVFRPEMAGGTLMGFPFALTTQVPGSGATGEMYLVDFADVVIGDSMNLAVDQSMEAAYFDGATVQAAFSLDQTVIRVIQEHDFALRRDVSGAVMTAMSY